MTITETRTLNDDLAKKKKRKRKVYYCPNCDICFGERKIGAFKYCYNCGGKLDWK